MTDILDNLAKEVDKISETEDFSPKSVKKEEENKKEIGITQKNSESSVMDNLLENNIFNFPRIGDTISGKVINVSSNEIYLDLAPFGAGVVLGKEIKDGLGNEKLKIGNTVNAIITDLENEEGYIELSIREASYEKAWDDIESKKDTQDKVFTKIISANKGGLLAEINGISGFLPVSQLSSKNYPRVEDGDKNKILNLLKKLVGQELEVRILDTDRENKKLIVSEKAAQSEKDQEIIANLAVGNEISGEISGVVDFGAFVKFLQNKDGIELQDERKLEGLVHISELAWQLIENPRTIVKVGDKVKAKIIGIDGDKISLSMRALQKDPWSEIDKKYKIGDIVPGMVNKINHFGAFVYLDKDIHGLAHISEMSEKYPGKTINEMIKAGEKYDWTILSIEPATHRMGLVLAKKSQKKAEEKQNDTEKKTRKSTEIKAQNDTKKKEAKKTTKKKVKTQKDTEEIQSDTEKKVKKVKKVHPIE